MRGNGNHQMSANVGREEGKRREKGREKRREGKEFVGNIREVCRGKCIENNTEKGEGVNERQEGRRREDAKKLFTAERESLSLDWLRLLLTGLVASYQLGGFLPAWWLLTGLMVFLIGLLFDHVQNRNFTMKFNAWSIHPISNVKIN